MGAAGGDPQGSLLEPTSQRVHRQPKRREERGERSFMSCEVEDIGGVKSSR